MNKVKNALEKSISAMSGLYGGWRCESAIRLCEKALAELEQSTAESTMLNTCLAFDKQEPAQAEDQSNSSIQLAKMIMSDCGVSDNCESLVNRIAGRIDAAQKQEPAQAVPYAWHVPPMSRMYFGEYAQIDAESEAKRVGGTAKAIPLYNHPAPLDSDTRKPLSASYINDVVSEFVRVPKDLTQSEFIPVESIEKLVRKIELAHGILEAG